MVHLIYIRTTQSVRSSAGMKSKEAELIQNLFLVGAGPSLNTWPRCAEHLEHRTSVRTIPGRVKTSNIFAPTFYFKPKSVHR